MSRSTSLEDLRITLEEPACDTRPLMESSEGWWTRNVSRPMRRSTRRLRQWMWPDSYADLDYEEVDTLPPLSYTDDRHHRRGLAGSSLGGRSDFRSRSGSLRRPSTRQVAARSATISMEYLKEHDTRPMYLAWGMFAAYVACGLFYFMFFKQYNFRDSLFSIINSLSAVSYGDFEPDNTLQKFLTIFFLIFGVGFMGTFVGMIASRGLEFQDHVRNEWLKRQNELGDDEEDLGPSLLEMQMRFARSRVFKNIFRILTAILLGSVFFTVVEKWKYGYAVYFCAQEIMGAGWVDVMPVTEPGQWFLLFYAFLGSVLMYHALGDLATVPLALRESKFEADVLGQWGDNLTEDKLHSLARRAEDIGKSKVRRPFETSESSESIETPRKKHKVTRDEFVLSMMLLLGRVDMRHIREAQKVFDQLDKDKTGILDEADVVKHLDDRGMTWARYRKHGSTVSNLSDTTADDAKRKASQHSNRTSLESIFDQGPLESKEVNGMGGDGVFNGNGNGNNFADDAKS